MLALLSLCLLCVIINRIQDLKSPKFKFCSFFYIMLWFRFPNEDGFLICFYVNVVCISTGSHQLIQIFPEVLSHQSKQRQKGPTEGIKACIAIIRISTSFHTHISFWTLTIKGTKESITRSSDFLFW